MCHFREALRIKFLYIPSKNLALKTVREVILSEAWCQCPHGVGESLLPSLSFADNASALTHAFSLSVSLYFFFCSFSPPFLEWLDLTLKWKFFSTSLGLWTSTLGSSDSQDLSHWASVTLRTCHTGLQWLPGPVTLGSSDSQVGPSTLQLSDRWWSLSRVWGL